VCTLGRLVVNILERQYNEIPKIPQQFQYAISKYQVILKPLGTTKTNSINSIVLTSRDAKIKSRGFPILESREVNITFLKLLWNDQS
jgi:hypothetical protein